MSRDRCTNRLWTEQLEHCNVFFLIKMEENHIPPILCRNQWGRNFMGERESRTQTYQCPSKSPLKLGVTAEPGAVPRYCHPWSLSRGLSLAVSTSSKVCSGESSPHTWGSTPCSLGPGPDFHLSRRVMGSTVTKPPWKERGERDHKQKKQMTFTFYICFLLRELLLWVKSAETSQVIAAWIFKPGYKYLGFLNSDYCLCFLSIYSPLI